MLWRLDKKRRRHNPAIRQLAIFKHPIPPLMTINPCVSGIPNMASGYPYSNPPRKPPGFGSSSPSIKKEARSRHRIYLDSEMDALLPCKWPNECVFLKNLNPCSGKLRKGSIGFNAVPYSRPMQEKHPNENFFHGHPSLYYYLDPRFIDLEDYVTRGMFSPRLHLKTNLGLGRRDSLASKVKAIHLKCARGTGCQLIKII